MLACVRGVFASATRTSIGGLRKSTPPSQVPDPAIGWTCRFIMTLLAPIISRRRKDRSPIHCRAGHCGTQCPERVVVALSLCLPPVECCRGTSPSVTPEACLQHAAAKSRPLRRSQGARGQPEPWRSTAQFPGSSSACTPPHSLWRAN